MGFGHSIPQGSSQKQTRELKLESKLISAPTDGMERNLKRIFIISNTLDVGSECIQSLCKVEVWTDVSALAVQIWTEEVIFLCPSVM